MDDTTTCPECGAIAEVLWREELESTSGPIEHAKIQCLFRHHFLLPVSMLAGSGSTRAGEAPERGADRPSAERARHLPG